MKTQVLVLLLILTNTASIYGQGKVCISIDDVPNTALYRSMGNVNPLLKLLDSLHIPGSIFINENQVYKSDSVKQNLEYLNQWARHDLTELGNHTYGHSRYSAVGFDAFSQDIIRGHKITSDLAKNHNKRLSYFRFPYNDLGSDSLAHHQIDSFLQENNYTTAPFTVESSDWMFNYIYEYYLAKDSLHKANVIANLYVEKTLAYFDFFDSLCTRLYEKEIEHIYLCHDNRLNADYLGAIITRLKEKQYEFISIEEALNNPLYDQTDHYHKKWGVSWIYRWLDDHDERISWMRKEPDLTMVQKWYDRILVRQNAIEPVEFTSYFSGNEYDTVAQSLGGACLMGGGREHDEAMRWFLRRAQGGDILVLRASGSDGYNDYFLEQLGVPINSVETIVFSGPSAAKETYIFDRISKAEGIWFAGGNQWKYVEYWRNTAIDSLINIAIAARNVVIGGTSAGMAILGGNYFGAEHGTVSTEDALSDPLDKRVAVDTTPFLTPSYLQDVVTDTHYSNRNRQGRHVAFLASVSDKTKSNPYGIGCDEGVAVCLDTSGTARVYGQDVQEYGHAYFIQVNPKHPSETPEVLTNQAPLSWNHDGKALLVYRIKGSFSGEGSFDLTNWRSGKLGQWFYWSVENGVFKETIAN